MSGKSKSGWFARFVTGWKRTISFHSLDAAFRVHQTHCGSHSDSHMFPLSVCALGQNWGVSKQWKSSLSFCKLPEPTYFSLPIKRVHYGDEICLRYVSNLLWAIRWQPAARLFCMRMFTPAAIQVTAELDATSFMAPCAYQRVSLRKENAGATHFSIFLLQGRSLYRDAQQHRHFFSQSGSVCNAKTQTVTNRSCGGITTSGKFCLSIWQRIWFENTISVCGISLL